MDEFLRKNINLSIRRGEVHTMLGENGVGKSTLMNVLIGLYQPTEGSIYLNGKKVSISSPAQAVNLGIGMVHQHFMLIEAMTVFENIILGDRNTKGIFINREARKKEILELAERYGLDVELDKPITEIAVGAQQLAFVIGCIIMAALGANPFVALQSLWIGAFGNLRNLGTTLSCATPLMFTSLCACFAYRCGVFNLGGEGQFLIGSIVGCYIATQTGIEGMPAILLCLIAGAVAGGLWALIAGILKVYRGQNEMIITIMLNYVATLFMGVIYTNWLRDSSVP